MGLQGNGKRIEHFLTANDKEDLPLAARTFQDVYRTSMHRLAYYTASLSAPNRDSF